MSYKVVTISSHRPDAWYYLYDQFFKSLAGHPSIVIQPQYWGGLSTKPKVLYRAIEQGAIDTKYIIFTDCWDLVFARTPDDVMDRYLAFDSPIVISCEKNCFPDDLKEDFEKFNPKTDYKYLNSGFIVGEVEAIFTCLEAMDLPNLQDDHYDAEKGCNYHPNDQFEWQKVFVRQAVPMKLDYFQALSQTLHDEKIENFEFDKHGIKNKTIGSYPCAFHFNGGAKDNLSLREPILKHLNLS